MNATRKKRITYLMMGATLCLAAWAASAMPRRHAPPPLPTSDPPVTTPPRTPVTVAVPSERPRIEIVFALDTTSSMTGLIEGAKRKIWSIAEYMQTGQPKPIVRIGLVAYRDRGDEYVTKFFDLDEDLDRVFEKLSAFRAEGGGDMPEDVASGLHDAVFKTHWTEGQAVLKQIYLVGDAPPQHYQNGKDVFAIAKQAREKNIHINTVRCGDDAETKTAWTRISGAASGEFASIDAQGGMHHVATPFDDKLAALNRRLVETAIPYGAGAAEGMRRKESVAKMDSSTSAMRSSYRAKAGMLADAFEGDDLVNAYSARGAGAIAAAPSATLPAEMRALDSAGQAAYVAKKKAERDSVSAELKSANEEREAWIKKNASSGPKDGFDDKVRSAVKAQAAEAGLKF